MTLAVRRSGLDPDRVFVAACLIVPLAGLAVFFVYPLATMVERSFTEADGAFGLGNYVRILQGRASGWPRPIAS